jgi:hypothetical protein
VNQKLYIGGDFPASDTDNLIIDNFHYHVSNGGSYLTRTALTAGYYAKTDGGEDEAEQQIPPVASIAQPIEDFFIYPNPATNKLNIKTGMVAGSTIMVTDLLGVEVDKLTLDGSGNLYSLDLARYAAGTYIIRAHSANGNTVTERFVKE